MSKRNGKTIETIENIKLYRPTEKSKIASNAEQREENLRERTRIFAELKELTHTETDEELADMLWMKVADVRSSRLVWWNKMTHDKVMKGLMLWRYEESGMNPDIAVVKLNEKCNDLEESNSILKKELVEERKRCKNLSDANDALMGAASSKSDVPSTANGRIKELEYELEICKDKNITLSQNNDELIEEVNNCRDKSKPMIKVQRELDLYPKSEIPAEPSLKEKFTIELETMSQLMLQMSNTLKKSISKGNVQNGK